MSSAPFMGLPRGSRDLLPPAARRRRDLLRALLHAFERWGYAQVVTPTVEYYDVLAEGLSEADRRLCVRFIEAHTGDLVALRADITPQIARMVAGLRRAQVAWPDDAITRLCYAADVVRQPAGDREQTEYRQAGVELIGDPDPAADAELVALAHEALASIGLPHFRFDVSHRAVAGGVIDALPLRDADRSELAQLLARKDRGSVVDLLRMRGIDPRAIEATAALCDLYGPAAKTRDDAVFERAHASLDNAVSRRGLAELEAMLHHLQRVHPAAAAAVDVDLGEVRGFDYYSGLRLRVWAPGVDRPVLRGGRYDDLLGRYGTPAPATGFAIDLDALEIALPDDAAAAEVAPARVIAVHPEVDATAGRLEAARRSAAARSEGERAWVQPAVELARAQELAAWWGARALTFIEPDGDALRVASHRREASGWVRE
jgi:ATP phosphoribosyltransferase regulatory subunit